MQNVVGKVYRNSTGFLYKSPVLIDLAKTGLIPGWHKMTVQGKTLDTVQKGVQTGGQGRDSKQQLPEG